jgi:hypothetical protein
VAGIRAGRVAGVEDADDLAVVRFVHAGQAPARQDPAGEPAHDSHVATLDRITAGVVTGPRKKCGSSVILDRCYRFSRFSTVLRVLVPLGSSGFWNCWFNGFPAAAPLVLSAGEGSRSVRKLGRARTSSNLTAPAEPAS